jgi:diguanylate cyclase (GGDEF)-like protein
MEPPPRTILIADDDPRILKFLETILGKAGYETLPAKNGREALAILDGHTPDLLLLDITMPEMDGLEVCRRLKKDPRWARVPMIFITGRDQTDDVVQGFEAGAADYITKPVNKATMLARVRTHLKLRELILELERLNRLALEANPLTGLPGNNSVAEAIGRAVEGREPVCVIYADLDRFKPFNDTYGFARGDEAIRFTAGVLGRSAEDVCGAGTFLGHIGGDDFALVVPAAKAEALGEEIARRFDAGIAGLYDPRDREEGGIHSVDRKGVKEFFPIMTLSMAGVDLSRRRCRHYLEVVNACAEVKKVAKSLPGSGICFDRRSRPAAP